MKNDKLHRVTFLLLVVGGINWLLEAFGVGIGRWLPDNVAMIIYILVGLSALYELATHKNCCQTCASPAATEPPANQVGQ